jgi:hypothetical protein
MPPGDARVEDEQDSASRSNRRLRPVQGQCGRDCELMVKPCQIPRSKDGVTHSACNVKREGAVVSEGRTEIRPIRLSLPPG